MGPAVRQTLGQLSATVEEQLFTGRRRELTAFRRWFSDDVPSSILAIRGQGGIGKSALLRAFARIAQGLGSRVVWIDGRTAASSPAELRARLGLDHATDVVEGASARRPLIVVDSCEHLLELSPNFYAEVLADVSATTKIVVAGRTLPPRWAAGGHWHRLIEPLVVGAFSRTESRAYLERAGVCDPEIAEQILQVAGGHPLALSLAAEIVQRRAVGDLVGAGEWHLVVRSLVDYLLQDVPRPELRAALTRCAVVRQFDEPMLAALAGDVVEPATAFDELFPLSVVSPAEHGLMLHPLVRRLLVQDLLWRRRETYDEQRTRALAHIKERIRSAGADELEPLISGWLFLAADSTTREVLFCDEEPDSPWLEPGRPGDAADLLHIWRCSLNSASDGSGQEPALGSGCERNVLQAVLACPDARVRLARTRDHAPVGFSIILSIGQDSALAMLNDHPDVATLIRAAWKPRSGLRAGQAAAEGTFLVHLASTGACPSAVQAALLRDCLGAFARGGTYVCCTPIAAQQRALEALGFERLEGTFTGIWGEAHPAVGYRLSLPHGQIESWVTSLTRGQQEYQAAAAVPTELTQREREVVALLSRGLTANRQIAAQLRITEGTANLHVKRILSKLGLTSRTQVIAWMHSAHSAPLGSG